MDCVDYYDYRHVIIMFLKNEFRKIETVDWKKFNRPNKFIIKKLMCFSGY